MEVRKLAAAAAVTPLGCQHNEIERVSTLYLEPARTAIAGFVGTLERLGHEAFVAGRARRTVDRPRLVPRGGDEPRNREPGRNARAQRGESLARRPVGEALAIDAQT